MTQVHVSDTSAVRDDPQVLIVGSTATIHQAADALEADGVDTMRTTSGLDALAQLEAHSPDLVIVGHGVEEMPSGEVIRRLRSRRRGRRWPLLLVGQPGDAPPAGAVAGQEQELPADVTVIDLIDHVYSRIARTPSPPVRGRRAVSEGRLSDELERLVARSNKRSARPGVLAAVSVAELVRLRAKLGPQAEQAIHAAFNDFFGVDAVRSEMHSPRSSDSFWLLMPDTTIAQARQRLGLLSTRVVNTVLDIGGEQVRLTPVIGYSAIVPTASKDDLRDRAATALDDASLHLDLVPVGYSPAMAPVTPAPVPKRDRLLSLIERVRSPMQIAFTFAMLLSLPFIVYVGIFYAGFDLTTITYPLMAAALAVTAAALWIESIHATGAVDVPAAPPGPYPPATAIIAAYLPNEAATIVDTVTNLLGQDYPGEFQVILAYNTPQHLPVEDTLAELAAHDSRLLLVKVVASTSKAQNVNAALAYVRGEFVGVFDADHHPAQGSFSRAWCWLSDGHDIVQGHCVVRNGESSWMARLIAVEFESIYAVSHPGRARLHGFGIFGGSNGYWRRDALREIRMQRSMLTEDIDSSMRSLRHGLSIVSDPGLLSSELAPTTLGAFWHQRMRWAQGWTQTARRHLRPAITSDRLSARQKLGAAFLLGWTQIVPWVTIQVVPILAFTAWRDGGLGHLDLLVPLFVLLSIFTFSVGIAQAVFAYVLGDRRIRSHPWWFVVYALHSMLWFGELKNLIARVAQLKEIIGERQWRVTPRTAAPARIRASAADGSEHAEPIPRGA